MSEELWTPVAFNLLQGLPFTYSINSISQISATEAFNIGIDDRDRGRCIVCGASSWPLLDHAHIVPRVEGDTWEVLRQKQLIPSHAKSVQHEARNGILLCKNHHALFDSFFFYIRWAPQAKRFVLINQSRSAQLEPFHGRAVQLFPASSRMPFHGAFLIHEMRVRGFQPLAPDRPIPLPIPWQTWIQLAPGSDDYGDDDDDNDDAGGNSVMREGIGRKDGDGDDDNNDGGDSVMREGTCLLSQPSAHNRPTTSDRISQQQSFRKMKLAPEPRKTLTFTNPFANPAKLESLKRSFAEQPNWKAAMVEGESWEGTAQENIEKWHGLVGPSQ